MGVMDPYGDSPPWAALAYLYHPAMQPARWVALDSRAEVQLFVLEHERYRHAHGDAGA